MTARNAHYFEGLDRLRVFAALSVLGVHVMGTNLWADVPASGPLAWLRCGWVGLDIFFVICGLVVGQSALARYRRDGAACRRGFIVHRLARIAPLYLLTGLMCVLFVQPLPDGTQGLVQVATHLAFVHNLGMATISSINPPSWSLAVEMQLYGILLLATPWLVRQRASTVAAASLALALAWRVGAYAWLCSQGVTDAGELQHWIAQTPGLVDSFGFGVAAAVALPRPDFPRVGRATGLLLIAAGLLGLAMLGLEIAQRVVAQTMWNGPAFAIVSRSGIAVAAALLVLGCALFPTQRAGALAAARRLGGHLSYGVYLWHFLVLTLLLRLDHASSWLFLAEVAGATVALAGITYFLIARPVLRRLAQTRAKSM